MMPKGQNYPKIKIFNVAQPGVGRVQVIGSKQVQAEVFHQSSALTVSRDSGICM